MVHKLLLIPATVVAVLVFVTMSNNEKNSTEFIIGEEQLVNHDSDLALLQDGRNYPSLFQAWDGIENLYGLTENERIASHDLYFDDTWGLGLGWQVSEAQPYEGMSTQLDSELLSEAQERKAFLKELNSDMILLCAILYREGDFVLYENEGPEFWEVGYLPEDSTFWLRDSKGEGIPGWGEDDNGDGVIEVDEVRNMLIDFTDEAFQDIIAQKAKALYESELYDGIFLDWWNETNATTGNYVDWDGTVYDLETETEARIELLKKIRANVGQDFLILVNANMDRVPESAAYVNGLFMESYKEDPYAGYTTEDLIKIENTLLWAETGLREPRINCLEGWSIVTNYDADQSERIQDRNNEENMALMRLFTTLSLTHSDGYVLFSDDNAMPSADHLHNWYDFWEVNLGEALGDKATTYENTEGLFIREYTEGFAVYNRSGQARQLTFDSEVKAVSTGLLGNTHEMPDLDGDIFLLP